MTSLFPDFTTRREMNKAEQGGQPERRLARFLNSKPVAAARLPWSFASKTVSYNPPRLLNF